MAISAAEAVLLRGYAVTGAVASDQALVTQGYAYAFVPGINYHCIRVVAVMRATPRATAVMLPTPRATAETC